MVARKAAEPDQETLEDTAPLSEDELAESAKQNAEAEEARAEAAESGTVEVKRESSLADLTDVDLVDQETGAPAPLSASTENLQATVSNQSGRAILKVAVRGYIGEEPVAILAKDAGEFAALIGALEKAAAEQKKSAKK